MAEPRDGELGPAIIRRILIALDASRESLATLETAAHMANRLQAELAGLFVEDVNLFKLAALPFAREVNLLTRSGRSLDTQTMERELRAQAAMARQALAEAAERLNVPWSFRVTRGSVEAELLAASLEADLIAVGRSVGPLTGRARLGWTASALRVRSSHSLLFGVSALPAGDAVALAYDGSEVAGDALDVAWRIADNDGGRLLVFLIGEDGDAAAEHEAGVRRRLRGTKLELRFRRVRRAGCAAMLPVIEAERPRLLVVGVNPGGEIDAALAPIVECVGCPVLMVRPRAAAA